MLYHKDIGFPTSLDIPEGMVSLWYSAHAKDRIVGKYKGQLILPTFIKITKNNTVEVSSEDNITVNKVMVRTTYNEKKDICVVLIPQTGKVVTLWMNYKNDKHDTLDKSKYDKP
jgi:hypothetical protein